MLWTAPLALAAAPVPSAPPAPARASATASALTVDQAVAMCLKGNLDLLAARYSVPMAQANELSAGAWGNPSLMADAQYQPFQGMWNQTNCGGPRQYDLDLTQPVDLSGKRSAAVRSAKAATELARLGFLDAVRQKILLVRQDYFGVVAQHAQVRLARESEAAYVHLVGVLERRLGARGGQPLLLARARLALDQSRLNLRQMEAGLDASKGQLAVQLNLASLGSATAATELRPRKLPAAPALDALVALAMRHRPDYLELKESLAKAGLDHALAEAQVWDDVSLTWGLTSQGPQEGNAVAPNLPQVFSWNAAVNLPLPVLDQNRGAIREASLAGLQARAQMRSFRLGLRQELLAELRQLALDRSLIRDYEGSQIRDARKVRDAEQVQFGTGSLDLLDYFDALDAYTAVLTGYYGCLADYRSQAAQLDASVGKDVL